MSSETYLGQFSGNPFALNSTSNPYGSAGNPYSPNSITHSYGSPYSERCIKPLLQMVDRPCAIKMESSALA
jgi:hypothetical protein